MTVELALSAHAARTLTEEVRSDVASLWMKVVLLYDGAAHLALGYPSWASYWAEEFGDSPARGFSLVRVGRVAVELNSRELPVPIYSVARELAPLLSDPDRLAQVWAQAGPDSNAREVAELVSTHKPKRGQQPSIVKRQRNLVRTPLARARGSAAAVRDGMEEALSTDPKAELLADWLTEIDDARAALADAARQIQAKLR